MQAQTYEYDVFISHAIEDKIAIANELSEKLKEAGLNVWFSGSEFRFGDNLKTSIQKGLKKSRFGVILITKNFILKGSELKEIYPFLLERNEDEQILLPVFHGLKKNEINNVLSLGNAEGISTEEGLLVILKKIISKVRKNEYAVYK